AWRSVSDTGPGSATRCAEPDIAAKDAYRLNFIGEFVLNDVVKLAAEAAQYLPVTAIDRTTVLPDSRTDLATDEIGTVSERCGRIWRNWRKITRPNSAALGVEKKI